MPSPVGLHENLYSQIKRPERECCNLSSSPVSSLAFFYDTLLSLSVTYFLHEFYVRANTHVRGVWPLICRWQKKSIAKHSVKNESKSDLLQLTVGEKLGTLTGNNRNTDCVWHRPYKFCDMNRGEFIFRIPSKNGIQLLQYSEYCLCWSPYL